MVYANSKDLDIIKQTGTSISYNPESNAKLFVGIAPVLDFLEKGIVVGLGTDGSASNNNLNFFGEMGTGFLLQAVKYKDKSIENFKASHMLKMGTIEGAKALGLDDQIGTIEVGKKADVIAIDLNQAHFYPRYNMISHLISSANGSEVTFVMVEGNILMEDRKVKTLDEEAIYEESTQAGERVEEFLNDHRQFTK